MPWDVSVHVFVYSLSSLWIIVSCSSHSWHILFLWELGLNGSFRLRVDRWWLGHCHSPIAHWTQARYSSEYCIRAEKSDYPGNGGHWQRATLTRKDIRNMPCAESTPSQVLGDQEHWVKLRWLFNTKAQSHTKMCFTQEEAHLPIEYAVGGAV